MDCRISYLSPAISAKTANSRDAPLSWVTMKSAGQPRSTAQPPYARRNSHSRELRTPYEISPERWMRINPDSGSSALENLRQATQRVHGDLLEEVVTHLDAHDATSDYLGEVARLKSQYNPYDKIPSGRTFIINVGANTVHRQQSPLFDDGTFEFCTDSLRLRRRV